jgi:hypothetical protein
MTIEDVKIPDLPDKSKKMIDSVIDMDVESAFKSCYENDTFFEIVTSKNYGDIKNFTVSPWEDTDDDTVVSWLTIF